VTLFSDTFETDTRAAYNIYSGALAYVGAEKRLNNPTLSDARFVHAGWAIDENVDFAFKVTSSGTLTARIAQFVKWRDANNYVEISYDFVTSGGSTLRIRERLEGAFTDMAGPLVITNMAASTDRWFRVRFTGTTITAGWYSGNPYTGGALIQELAHTLVGGQLTRWGPLVKGKIGGRFNPDSGSWRLDDVRVESTAYVRNPPILVPAGPFHKDAMPDETVKFGAATSYFNREIPTDVPVHPRSAEMVANLLATTPGDTPGPGHMLVNADTTGDVDVPIYFAEETDPLWTLNATGFQDPPNFDDFFGNGLQIHIPDGAKPAAGQDHHFAVVQPDGTCWDIYKSTNTVFAASDPDKTLDFRWGARTTDFMSATSPLTDDGGAIAPNWQAFPGHIRACELEAGLIEHAIICTIRCCGRDFAWPARKNGLMCADIVGGPESEVDRVGMGHRIQLDYPDEEIDALAQPPWRKAIYRAMARYGMVPGDTNSSSLFLRKASSTQHTAFGYDDPFAALAADLFYAGTAGVFLSGGQFGFNVREGGIDWSRLRVVDMGSARRVKVDDEWREKPVKRLVDGEWRDVAIGVA
jgi:hypothetical protein